MRHHRGLPALLLFAAACGGSSANDLSGGPGPLDSGAPAFEDAATNPDAGISPDAATQADASSLDSGDGGGFATASHLPLPQVPDQGGPRLTSVELVTVTFPGFSHETDIEKFGSWIVTSSWYATVGKDYGVGPGTHQHVTLATAAPTTVASTDIAAFLKGLIAAGTLPGGIQSTPTNYLYMIYYPPETTVTDLVGGCATNQDYSSSAWHDALVDSTASFAYAVIPTCSKQLVSDIEVGASHELIEAATDAYPLEKIAYQMPSSSPWYYVGEVGDLCEFMDPLVDPSGFSVQRIYSNSAAAAGSWPCVPAPAGPYVNVSAGPQVTVAKGQTVKVPVTGWSTAPTAPFTVSASVIGYDASFNPIQVTASLDQGSFDNGVVRTLTLTVPASATSGNGSVLLFTQEGQSYVSLWSVGVTIP